MTAALTWIGEVGSGENSDSERASGQIYKYEDHQHVSTLSNRVAVCHVQLLKFKIKIK